VKQYSNQSETEQHAKTVDKAYKQCGYWIDANAPPRATEETGEAVIRGSRLIGEGVATHCDELWVVL